MYIKINIKSINREKINLVVNFLKKGKIIVYPTDTIYGLGCIATNKKSINKIYKIKKRKKNKPLLILVSSFAMLKKYCFVSKAQYNYLNKFWPGSISVVLKSRGILPDELTGGINSVAVRLPKNDFLIKMIRGVNKPIVSTSLNLSGNKYINNLNSLDKYFKNYKPDLVIDSGKIKKNKPSKIIDLRNMSKIKTLR